MADVNKAFLTVEKEAAEAVMEVENDEESIDLYAMMLRIIEKWYMIVAFALIGAILTGIYSFCFITPMYKATSKIYVMNNKDSAVNLSDLQISTYLTNDYKEVFDVWEVHEMVMQKIGVDYSYKKIASMVDVTNPASTRILYITVTSADPAEAQSLANAYAEVSREFIATKMDTAMPAILEEALLPTNPSSPNKMRNTLIGFLMGIILAVAIIVVRFLADDYVRTADDIERCVHLPVLGTVMMQNGPEFSGNVNARKNVRGGNGKR